MRFLLAFMLITAITDADKTPATMPAPSSQSVESLSLKKDVETLILSRNTAQAKAIFWDSWYMSLGVCALVLGVVSWGFQKRSSKLNGDVRDLTTSIESKETRIRALADQEFADQIQESKKTGDIALSDAGTANTKAEAEKLARVKLEASIAPRRLSDAQKNALGAACLGISGKPIIVRSYQLDPEAFVLGDQIASALEAKGISVTAQLGFAQSSGYPDVGIQLHGPPESAELLECLRKQLEASQLAATVNGPRHRMDTLIGGGNFMINGDETMLPAGPLPAGQRVLIMIGVKPPHLVR